jgi:hypothetical protein
MYVSPKMIVVDRCDLFLNKNKKNSDFFITTGLAS